MQTLGPLKLKKTGLEVRPAVFSEQTEKSYFFFKYRQLPAFFYSLPRGSLKTATVA